MLILSLSIITSAARVCPLDVYLNDTLYKSYGSLDKLCYTLTVRKTTMQGITLDEILPVMIDAYRMRITTHDNTYDVADGNLADKLTGYYIGLQDNALTLYLNDKVFPGVERIEIRGEAETNRELECWVSWEGVPALKEAIARFAGLHNLTIKTTDVPQIESKLLAVSRGGGTLPDAVMVQSDYLPALTAARVLQNVGYMVPAGLTPRGLEAFRLDKVLWAIPFYFDTQVVFYNPQLTGGKLPLVWNLDDLERIALPLKKRGIIPLCWNAYSAYWLIPFQFGFGKQAVTEPDGRIIINDKATKQAFAYLVGLRDKGLMQPAEKDAMLAWFVAGKTAMIFSGSYSIPELTELGIPFSVAPYPVNTTTGKALAPLLDFKGWAITRKTKHPILARRLIEYLTGIGVQQRFVLPLAKMPANNFAWAEASKSNPWFAVLQKSYETGAVLPPAPAYPVFKNTMWKLIRFIFEDSMSIDETLETGQKIIDGKLDLNSY